jgi:4-diphosphocytidyl-2-C-methyl-D-erythritol kinase
MAERRRALAKLNLYLHVLGRRPDGYHRLDSLVAFTEVGDDVIADTAPALSLELTGPYAGALGETPRDNLVWRAAELLAAHAKRDSGAALTLVKNLPVASGIGGGSSDAAATLRALAALWRLAIGEDQLAALGARLGADVPVCLFGRPAWVGGIGEQIEPAPGLPESAVLLVNPGIALATPQVFAARRGAFSAPARFTERPANAARLAALLAERRNDLTEAALALCPPIAAVLEHLARLEGSLIARMSGSGATCFALFVSLEEAEAAARRLRATQSDWWVAAARLS